MKEKEKAKTEVAPAKVVHKVTTVIKDDGTMNIVVETDLKGLTDNASNIFRAVKKIVGAVVTNSFD